MLTGKSFPLIYQVSGISNISLRPTNNPILFSFLLENNGVIATPAKAGINFQSTPTFADGDSIQIDEVIFYFRNIPSGDDISLIDSYTLLPLSQTEIVYILYEKMMENVILNSRYLIWLERSSFNIIYLQSRLTGVAAPIFLYNNSFSNIKIQGSYSIPGTASTNAYGKEGYGVYLKIFKYNKNITQFPYGNSIYPYLPIPGWECITTLEKLVYSETSSFDFEISDILNTFVHITPPILDDIKGKLHDTQIVKYGLEFGIFYDNYGSRIYKRVDTRSLYGDETTETSSFASVGGIEYLYERDEIDADYTKYYLRNTSQSYPLHLDMLESKIHRNSKLWYNFIQYYYLPNMGYRFLSLRYDIEWMDGTTTIEYTPIPYVFQTYQTYGGFISLPVHSINFSLLETINNKEIKRFSVYPIQHTTISNSNFGVKCGSEKYYSFISDSCLYNGDIVFNNRLGGWDTLTIEGSISSIMDVNRRENKKYPDLFTQKKWEQEETNIFSVEAQENLEVRVGVFEKEYFKYLVELHLSQKLYFLYKDKWYSCSIINSNFKSDTKEETIDLLLNLKINLYNNHEN